MNEERSDIDFYTTNNEHIMDECLLMDFIVRSYVRLNRNEINADNELMGLYISEKEISEYLKTPAFNSNISGSRMDKKIPDMIDDMRREIDRRVKVSKKQGTELRLEKLVEVYNINNFEKNVLILCLLQEIDLKYGVFFAYLNNNITKKRVIVDLVLNLFCNSFNEKQMNIKVFSGESPLVRNHLIKIFDKHEGINLQFLERILEIDEPIKDFLIQDHPEFETKNPFTCMYDGLHNVDDLILPDKICSKIRAGVRVCGRNVPMVFFMHGPRGSGKKASASLISSQVCKEMLLADISRMIGPDFALHTKLVCREALLRDRIVYFDNFEVLLEEDAKHLDLFIKELEDFNGTAFLGSAENWEPSGAFQTKEYIRIDFPSPAFPERKKLFEKYLSHLDNTEFTSEDIDELASGFKFGAGQIIDAIHSAKNIAAMEETETKECVLINKDHLNLGCRKQSNKNLLNYANLIESNYTWDDIILHSDSIEQLKEISSYVKNHHVVYSKWGYGKKLSMGKGLNVLFAGPSGTGKTMAAGIIAKYLGLDLYRIDLSTMVSKYIGETEKNLNKVFHEARTSNSIVFFDEADALFGKRTEIKDAHDRYANIEVSYLLQKMEEDGINILASNLKNNIDEAFLRRMHFSIDFPFPDEGCRKSIWEIMIPKDAPIEKDIDYTFLARRFKLSGGNIKNVHISAAFLAAELHETIGMKHIIRAIKRELQKLGRSITAADFGEYYEYLESD